MKASLKTLFLAIFGIIATVVSAQTENTDVFANILTPISITETANLHFGTMSVSGTAGTCVLTAAGVRSKTGGVTLNASSPTATSAAYSVSGSANMTYSITLPSSAVTVTNSSNSSQTMTVSAFTSSKTGNIGTLNSSASDSFTVGATLNVSANQPAGLYQGNFNVTVAYN